MTSVMTRAVLVISLYLSFSQDELSDKENITCPFSFYIHESDSLLSPTPEISGNLEFVVYFFSF